MLITVLSNPTPLISVWFSPQLRSWTSVCRRGPLLWWVLSGCLRASVSTRWVSWSSWTASSHTPRLNSRRLNTTRNRYRRRGTINSLWLSDVIWRQGSRSTLAQVMACCLTAPSHYLNQCWLMISEVLWHSPDSNSTENMKIFIFEMSLKFTCLRL